MAQKPPDPGRPKGRAKNWTPAEIARLSRVTPEDVASARAQFKRQAPKPIKKLLDPPKP